MVAGLSGQSFSDEAWASRDAEAHEIADGIFLGSVKAATDSKALERWKITHILVVDPTSSILWPSRFSYKRVKLDDVPTANLLEVLPEALSFLGEAQLRRGPVLIHCTRGISRSASVVIAFLMLFKRLSYKEAKSRVEAKRVMIYPNIGFQVQLQHLESLAKLAAPGHWGEKMKWLKDAVPRGNLTGVGPSFALRHAMSAPVRMHLEQVRSWSEAAEIDSTILQQRASWKTHGLFFEYLQKYRAVPKDHSLLKEAAAVVEQIKELVQNSDLAGARAASDLAADLETWILIAGPVLEAEAANCSESTAIDVEDVSSGGEEDVRNTESAVKKRRTNGQT
ncbi:unnamed protein product [Polarella glacialis]|uniref:Protein-tyrosine-phosphatase n=1 Tax=Polarella glacialis TaxID=89957 RepID=A0A813EB79_POLGL|nr:unnamed protein product [Polarella glacialis]CAE8710870.1 unnamed protein product [Polarella glacialis]